MARNSQSVASLMKLQRWSPVCNRGHKFGLPDNIDQLLAHREQQSYAVATSTDAKDAEWGIGRARLCGRLIVRGNCSAHDVGRKVGIPDSRGIYTS